MDLKIDWSWAPVGVTAENALELRVDLDAEPDAIWRASFNLTASERQSAWKRAGRRWGTVEIDGQTIVVAPVDETEEPILRAELEDLVEHANRVTGN